MNIVMELYHGTTKDSAEKILKKVDVKLGGGELGRGFYLGGTCYLAYSCKDCSIFFLGEVKTQITNE